MNRWRFAMALSLLGVFLYDLVASSLAVARIVMSRRGAYAPAIVAVPVDARTEWGLALFAYLVSLTPGSTCLHVADDRKFIYVHFLDAPDVAKRAAEIKELYERLIIELEGPQPETAV